MKPTEEIVSKWKANGMSASAQNSWKSGISRVTESPTAKAARNLDKYLASTQEAVTSGRMAAALQSVTLGAWQQSCANKAGRLATGIADAEPKYRAFIAGFGPKIEAAQSQVNSMPSTTYEERKAKSAAMQDLLHAAKGQWRGRFA